MTVGSKVVCINDVFPTWVKQLYKFLPKANVVYVIRGMTVGVGYDETGKRTEGEICLYLIGLNNPRSGKAPFRERGFNAERFRPLDEVQGVARESEQRVDAIAVDE